jgi:lichenan operon transcriptional antiterminator
MKLTNRQKSILLYLLNSIRFGVSAEIPGKHIADYLHISLRTLQNEIKNINTSLNFKIVTSNNKGYTLNTNLIQNLHLTSLQAEDYAEQLLKVLILESGPFNIDDLTERFYTSPSALHKRIQKLNILLADYKLSITKAKNCIEIYGNEYNKRRLIHNIIMKESNTTNNALELAANYLKNLNLVEIQSIIMASINKYKYYIEPCYTTNLIVNIMIALSRIYNNCTIDILESTDIEHTTEYSIAKDICYQVEIRSGISIKEKDVLYICMTIMGQVKPLNINPGLPPIDEQQSAVIMNIIENTFHYYMLNIDYNDYLPNFIYHISSLLVRAKNKQLVINLISENIKETSPFTYDVAVHLAKSLEDHFHLSINEEEIGLLSIYIGFIINQSTSNEEKIRVLLVCSEYQNIANYLINKLKEDYENKIEIINVLTNSSDIKCIKNVDLIIHTMPIPVLGKNTLLISPFYTLEDSEKIDNYINQISIVKKKNKNLKLLMNYFDEKLYFKDLGIKTKEEAIRYLGTKAEDCHLCEKGFTKSVLKRESMSSTCFLKTFAVPHAIEMNAKQTKFCVLIEKNGVQWDDNLIRYIFMIAVCKEDRKEFMKIYSGIIQILCNPESVENLVTAPDFKSFINCFNQSKIY